MESPDSHPQTLKNTSTKEPVSYLEPDDANATPMLKQYQAIKDKNKDCILLFRLGDFYEMFFDDAKVASRALDLVLTSRSKTATQRIPMCGFPFHAADNYIARLIKAGHKVAICEQLEDPALAKGIVKRDIIRVITSGTFLDENSTLPRYILCLCLNNKTIGLAFSDPSSGTIHANEYPNDKNRLIERIAKLPIFECVFPQGQEDEVRNLFQSSLLKNKNIVLSPYEDWCFNSDIAKKSLCEHFGVHNLSGFGIDSFECAISSVGALLEYLKAMNKQPLRHMDKISLYSDDDFVVISPAAYRGLELDNLIKTLDYTLTALGTRKFRFWIEHPLKNVVAIEERQKAIGTLRKNNSSQTEIKLHFSKIPDLEKHISRLSCGYALPKDLLAIRNVLVDLPTLKTIVDPLAKANNLFSLDDIPQLRTFLEQAINENIPLANSEGKVIRLGFNVELDKLRDIQENGREFLKDFQQREIKRTGINSLKIGFNNIFGYYIEVTKTNLGQVPSDYIRKQTLVNAERFITPELKEFEEKILTAEDKIKKLETELILQIQAKILDNSVELHKLCSNIATIDAIYSLTVLSSSPNYTQPIVNDETIIDIKDGRHPVVEKFLNDEFIANDTFLDCAENHLIILTGPNMSGKSTFIRQTAILTILAQAGSFLPAESATVGLVDKIFTRIGAHDDITKGQSTFMVEMNETADILNNLTDRSLVILDEIGRGTSTYDGLSLAWALAEHLQKLKARTLFATHFHELTALANQYTGVKNYNVAVKEWKNEIVFLHKIIPGSTDDSYGIYVAKLAGIPSNVIERAKKILSKLETQNNLKSKLKNKISNESQIDMFSAATNDPILEEIKDTIAALNVNSLTPLDALNKMQKLKELIEENGKS